MAGSEEVGGAATPEFQAIKTVMVVIGMCFLRMNLRTIPQLGARILKKLFSSSCYAFELHIAFGAQDFVWMPQACHRRIIECGCGFFCLIKEGQ